MVAIPPGVDPQSTNALQLIAFRPSAASIDTPPNVAVIPAPRKSVVVSETPPSVGSLTCEAMTRGSM